MAEHKNAQPDPIAALVNGSDVEERRARIRKAVRFAAARLEGDALRKLEKQLGEFLRQHVPETKSR